ncbi:hypothetical protein HDU86_003533 [Geranomyces michiganensis]|nr:hypothetical protein HDU86_003533 [Geranomyces michiganensis]
MFAPATPPPQGSLFSAPSPAPAQRSPPALATNTIIITNLSPAAFSAAAETTTRAACERFGSLSQFVPLKAFGRALVVYKRTADAQQARRLMHETDVSGSRVRVYFGQHTDTSRLLDPALGTHIDHLRVPALERNFLLSPPGSPPIDWVQIRESSPVAGGHSDALHDALRELHEDDFRLDDGGASDTEDEQDEEEEAEEQVDDTDRGNDDGSALSSTPGRHVLVFTPPPNSHAARSKLGVAELPVIIVENTDVDRTQQERASSSMRPATPMVVPAIVMPEDEPQWPRRQAATPLPKTAMPPAPSSGW